MTSTLPTPNEIVSDRHHRLVEKTITQSTFQFQDTKIKEELDSLLYKRYPKIFADRQGTMCRDGWYNLVDVLCERLQAWSDLNGAPQVVVTEVKEKWGELSFNAKGGSREQDGMIIMAEEMSARICELCGNAGKLLVAGETYLTRCHLHAPGGATTASTF